MFIWSYINIYIYIKLCKQRSAFGRGALSSGWNTQFVGRKACSSIGLSCNVAVPVQFVLYDLLNHQGRLTHIWVNKLTLIVSDNGLSPGRHQAITWNSAELFSIGPLGTIFEWFWSPKKPWLSLKILSHLLLSHRLTVHVVCHLIWYGSMHPKHCANSILTHWGRD